MEAINCINGAVQDNKGIDAHWNCFDDAHCIQTSIPAKAIKNSMEQFITQIP